MGLKVGLFRPKTLWPFPSEPLLKLSRSVSHIVVFEMSTGQMVEDVRLAVEGRCPVSFYGRPGELCLRRTRFAKVLSGICHKIHPNANWSAVKDFEAPAAATASK